MGRPRPPAEREAFRRWLADPERSMKKLEDDTGIPHSNLYRWRELYGWKEEARELAERELGIAILGSQLAMGEALDRLVQVLAKNDTAPRDLINGVKLLHSIATGGSHREAGQPSTYVDKMLVMQMAELPTADLLKLAAGGLEANISDAQQQRVSKRQTVPGS